MTDPFDSDISDLLGRRADQASVSPDARRRIDEKARRRSHRQRALLGASAFVVVALLGVGLALGAGSDGDERESLDVAGTDEPDLFEATTALTHQLGRESVLSAAAMGEGGEVFDDELADQRAATDDAVDALRPLLDGLAGVSAPPTTEPCDDTLVEEMQTDESVTTHTVARCVPATAICPLEPTTCTQLTRPVTAALVEQDLVDLRAMVDDPQASPVATVDGYSSFQQGLLDSATLLVVDEPEGTRIIVTDKLSYERAVAFTSARAAQRIVAVGLPPETHTLACPEVSEFCDAMGAMKEANLAADDQFALWRTGASPGAAAELDRIIDDDAFHTVPQTESGPPFLNDNVTFVPVALRMLDELAALDAGAVTPEPPATVTPDTTVPPTGPTPGPDGAIAARESLLLRSAGAVYLLARQQVMTADYVGREATDVDEALVRQQDNTAAELVGFAEEIEELDEPERSAWRDANARLASAHEELVSIAANESIGDPAAAAQRAQALRAVADGPEDFVRAALEIVGDDPGAVQVLGWLAAMNQRAAQYAVLTEVGFSADRWFDPEDWQAYDRARESADQLQKVWYESTTPELGQRYDAIRANGIERIMNESTDAGTPEVDPEAWLADVLARLEQFNELSLDILAAGD